ncbi:glycosyltransferase family 4 protein [Deinococcus sp.]|uniref:glycosyltransferase family 4 protein n=1 Tax=Deinococcus sp. TaxID=47478 RepID=UPI0025C5493A|nr:glycosyltransferase family 4 protein [Deinococcus sp.]
MSGLRILALNWRSLEHPQAGGGEINLFEQAQRWARDGHQVTVLCGDSGRTLAPRQVSVEHGVIIRRMGGKFSVYACAALFLLRYGRQFDRILDISNGVPFFSPLFTRTPSALLIHHVHGEQWFSEFPAPVARFGQLLESKVVPRLYRDRPVITVSPSTEEGLLRLGYRQQQISVIYNGVQLPPQTALRPPAAQRVLYLGRVKKYKRVDLLVRAVASLRGRFPQIFLDIAGDGDARPELEDLVRELGLQENVKIHGFVDDAQKEALLAVATVFAQPSMHEGWGISVIEANAYGCPAVAYDVPGLRVAVQDGVTGILAQNDQDFAEGIGRLLGDARLRARYSAAALEWARRFDWDASAQASLDVLKHAGATPGQRPGYGR